ncbi:serpin B11-like, partial [Notechis scutatus]|uniref:Serpin B11-like n=1 Tax=Notechis scutatus TaxID=8663 RepID=A0A6J1W6W3_9SAUR
ISQLVQAAPISHQTAFQISYAEDSQSAIWIKGLSFPGGEITNFFRANSIDRSTAMILLSTIFFQGKWKMPFNPKDTQRGIFWTCKDQSMYVDMMTQRGRFNIANILNPPMTVVEMLYENEEVSFVVLLPDNNVSTDEIIMNLTYEQLQEWTNPENMKSVPIKFSMPKFTVQNQYPLKGPFSDMGVKNLFIPGKADLSGMTGNNQLVVSQVYQAIVFTVSEEGSDAAGASRTE